MSVTAERIGEIIAPTLSELSLDLYDLEYEGGVLRIWLDRDGGIDVSSLTDATRRISALLDDQDPIASAYTLEVSSPGLERRLRTEAHFASAVGSEVKIKTRPGTPGDRRTRGTLRAAAAGSITLVDAEGDEHVIATGDIDRAHTVFDAGPAPKPGGPKPKSKSKSGPKSKSKPGSKSAPKPKSDSKSKSATSQSEASS